MELSSTPVVVSAVTFLSHWKIIKVSFLFPLVTCNGISFPFLSAPEWCDVAVLSPHPG